jgi:hypothetical protein
LIEKILKYFLIILSILFFILGQYQLLNYNNFSAGITFTLLFLIFLLIPILNFHLFIINKTIEFINCFRKLQNELEQQQKISKRIELEKTKITPEEKKDLIKELQEKRELSFKIFIPKWFFYVIVVILFILAQFFLIQNKLKNTLYLLGLDAIIIFVLILLKNKKIEFEIKFSTILKFLLMIGGIVLLIIGWILLINRNITKQEIGVVFTVLGVLLCFLGLPESKKISLESKVEYNESNILFSDNKFVNNYFFKIVLLLASYICILIGNKFIINADIGWLGITFYSFAGILIFLALPLINFPEKSYNNKIIDLIKLILLFVVFFIAYKGQQFFVRNNINEAIKLYFIAFLIFVFTFPIYKKETDLSEYNIKFPFKLEIFIVLVILAIGIFFRTYEIDIRPAGVENDEAGGWFLYNNERRNVGHTTLFFNICKFSELFTQDPRMNLKLMAILPSIIAIPAVYFLIRAIFNSPTAMFVTIIYSVLRWSVHYGRFGHGAIFTPIATILALYFLYKAFKSKNSFMWFIAGLTVGLTWHGVLTAFLLIIPFILYFLFKSLSQNNFFKEHFVSLLAFFLGFWIYGSMIIHNYFISEKIYFARAHEVSVFSKDPNAPSKNVWKGIMDNTKRVLLMFNKEGDSRQRNSGGQPYEPTIDFLTSIFFALGFIYSIYYSKYYLFFIMIMIFFSQAAGSIFSIEAPSAMRAIGTMIPVLFFVAIIFDKFLSSLRKVFGEKLGILYVPVILVIFLFPIIKENYRQYFQRWIGGMDELSTFAGMYAKELGKDYYVFLFTGLYYPGHPPFRIYRQDYKVNSAGRLSYGMQKLSTITDENFAFFFHYDTWHMLPDFQRVYFPQAQVKIIDHKYYNPKLKDIGMGEFVRALLVSNSEIKSKRGLNATYSFLKNQIIKNELPVFKKEFDSKIPYTVTWEGDILIPFYGRFRFINKGNVDYDLYIDYKKISKDSEILLAEGFHPVKITTSKKKIDDVIDLNIEAMELKGYTMQGKSFTKLNEKILYDFPNTGLHGYYYLGNSWDKDPIQTEVINETVFTNGPLYSDCVKWSGYLKTPEDGIYNISTHNNGYVRIVIDNKYFWEQGSVLSKETEEFFKDKNLQKVYTFNLRKGKHQIDIYGLNVTNLILYWSINNKPQVSIPIDCFEPDYKI